MARSKLGQGPNGSAPTKSDHQNRTMSEPLITDLVDENAMHGTLRRSPVFVGARRVSLFNRAMSQSIDILVALALYYLGRRLGHWWGPVIAFVYLTFKDGLPGGQSIGKKIAGIAVYEDSLGMTASLKDSGIRNMVFGLAALCLGSPFLWLPLLLLCIPWIIFEASLVYFVPTGVRLGDVLANTYVDEVHEVFPEDFELP